MMHLSGQSLKDKIALCGRPIDGLIHEQTMLASTVECSACLVILSAHRTEDAAERRSQRS